MNSLVSLFSAEPNEFNIKRSEILRYMQYSPSFDISELEPVINSCIEEYKLAARYRACYCKFNISKTSDYCIDFGFMNVKSHSLAINLKDCREAYAFAATTGINTERLLYKYNKISPARAFILDAIGSAAIEAFCDCLNTFLRKGTQEHGQFLRPRFSPGYGDFSISHQPYLLNALDANRKLNLTLTDSYLMVPAKSVTAIIGITDTPNNCISQSCELCNRNDCLYRK